MNRLPSRSVVAALMVGLAIATLVILYAAYERNDSMVAARAAFARNSVKAGVLTEDVVQGYLPLIQLLAKYVETGEGLPDHAQWRRLTAQLNAPGGSRPDSLWLLTSQPGAGPRDFSATLRAVDNAAHADFLGQDISQRPMLKEALLRARDSGAVAVSPLPALASGSEPQGGARIVLVAPIYGRTGSTGMPDKKRLRGFVVAEFRMLDVMARVIPALAPGMTVGITDRTAGGAIPLFAVDRPADDLPLFRETQNFLIGGRIWEIDYQSTREYEAAADIAQGRTLLGGGAVLAILIGTLVWWLMRGWSGAERQVRGAARELQASEERLRHVIAASNDGVWEYDLLDGVYTYLSPQAVNIFGSGRAGGMLARREDARSIIHPDDYQAVREAFEAHVRSGAGYDVEMRVRDIYNAWRWVRSRGEVIRDNDGPPRRMVGALSDISHARESAQRLRRYQALMRTVLDVIPEPVLVKDADYRLLMVNRAYADRAGIPADALIGKVTHEFMPAEQADRLVQADAQVFETGHDQVFEISIQNRLLHTVRNYIVTKRLAHDIDGAPIMVGLHSDVTELRRSIAQFAAVIEDTPLVAVQGFNRNCVVTHWNQASEAMFGYRRAQALGSRLQDLILAPRLQRMFEMGVEHIWASQGVFGPRELRLRLPGGRIAWLLVTIFPVVQEGVVVELFSMAVDVTARREAERQLAMHRDNLQVLVDERTAGLLRAKQEVEHALQAKSEFLANMSHELRTPMHAILSFARLGEERVGSGASERLRDYFSRIASSGDRLLGLINNLLDLSKLEAGKMMLDVSTVDVATLAHSVAHELEPLVEKKALSLVLPEASDGTRANVDASRFSQVIANLLSNAIKFSPFSGTITVTLESTQMPAGRRATDRGDRPALLLRVLDEGPGIPGEELEPIFEKFVQSTTTRTGAGGTGLGLAICREVVLAHKGRISAHNRPGGGAMFEVLVPVDTPVTVHGETAAKLD